MHFKESGLNNSISQRQREQLKGSCISHEVLHKLADLCYREAFTVRLSEVSGTKIMSWRSFSFPVATKCFEALCGLASLQEETSMRPSNWCCGVCSCRWKWTLLNMYIRKQTSKSPENTFCQSCDCCKY